MTPARSLRLIALFALSASTSACATSTRRAHARDHNLITREQILENHFVSAFDAVQSLHANWLNQRGANSPHSSGVLVYFDEIKLGGIDTLHSIRLRSVSYIRRFDGIEATTRWGLNHGAGVIYVSTHPVVVPS